MRKSKIKSSKKVKNVKRKNKIIPNPNKYNKYLTSKNGASFIIPFNYILIMLKKIRSL